LKKLIYILFLFFCAVETKSQQNAQFTQYLFNQFGQHPALAGWRDCMEFRFGGRAQWVGFPGAPKTAFANFHTSLSRKKRGYLKSKHGIGANIESDQMGPWGMTRIYLAYAYHIPINRKLKMAFGLYAGIQQYKLDIGKITTEAPDDNAITGKTNAFVYPDIWPSIFLYSNNFFAGATIRHAIHNKIRVITDDSHLRYHYNITAGKRFPFGENRSIVPSVNLKWASISAIELDLAAQLDFDNRFQLGVGWRNTDALFALARLNIRNFSFGYSFDWTTSKIKVGSSNTHEVIIGINTCKKDMRNSDECPAFN
jgi:type IX secretion system PorP/SprF family membrane protein